MSGYLAVPDNVKIFNGITKYVLREYLDINNQQKIASRFDKKGYSTPFAEWLLLNNSKILNETILCDNSKISDYIDRSLLIKYVSNLNPNDSQKSFHIFKLITAEMWLKNVFDFSNIKMDKKLLIIQPFIPSYREDFFFNLF